MSAARKAISVAIIFVACMATRANALGGSRAAAQSAVLCHIGCGVQYVGCTLSRGWWMGGCYGEYAVCSDGCDAPKAM